MDTIDLINDPAVTALAVPSKAAIVIRTADEYMEASLVLKQNKTAQDAIEAARVRITGPINAALKAANAQAREAAEPFLAQEVMIKDALVVYATEQKRLRDEEQRKANEIADKERRRLQAIADEARRIAAVRAAEMLKSAREAEAEGKAIQAQKLRESALMVERKADAKVDLYESQASTVVAAVSDRAAPKVQGISIPMIWTWELTDEAAIPREYLDLSEKRVNKVVSAMGGLCKIPGIRVFQKARVSSGRA